MSSLTRSGKIKIAALILAIFAIFGTITVLAGFKYIQSPFFETVFIYCKFGVLVAYDFAVFALQKVWGLFFTNWITVWVLLGVLLILILRWLFNYHSE